MPDERISFETIKGTVGSMLLLWARIEQALDEALLAQHGGQTPFPGAKGRCGTSLSLISVASISTKTGGNIRLQQENLGQPDRKSVV